MHFDLTGEFAALLFGLILLLYSRGSDMVPTLRDRYFRACLYGVVVSVAFTIASLVLLEPPFSTMAPLVLIDVVSLLFYLTTPMTAAMFLLYTVAFLFEDEGRVRRYMWVSSVPFLAYAAVVLTNPLTHFVYRIGAEGLKTDGPGLAVVYATVFLYTAAGVATILLFGRRIERQFRNVLLAFPILGTALVVVQSILTTARRPIVLIGTASTSALLIIYLFLQNKRIVVDELTGFKNRRAFSKVVGILLRRQRRFAVALVSLDGFKAVNAQFGQASGDRLLREVARYLASVVPIRDVYRYAGDEFALLLDDLGPDDFGPDALADRLAPIRARFESPWNGGPVPCRLSASIAALRAPDHAASVEDAIDLLEHCVALSKRNGHGRLVLPDAEMLLHVHRRHRVEEALRAAISEDRVEVLFQPILSTSDGRFRSAEALSRLHDPALGDILPSEFIPIAEESGLIVALGDRVLEAVCRFARRLEAALIPYDAISINCSSLQFFQEGFAEKTLTTLSASGVDPRRIHIEVTESVFIDRIEPVREIMRTLQEAGIQFYLDDFGTGYANLSTAVELPFRAVKLDRGLLQKAMGSRRTFTMMKSVAQAFHDCGMWVVVEGVETPEQRVLADRLGARLIQGFLAAGPLPAERAAELFSRH